MRFWNEFVAAWGDVVPLPLTVLALLLLAVVVTLLWYFWPSWWHALRRMGGGRRKAERAKDDTVRLIEEPEQADEPEDENVPDVEPAVLVSLADRYAAEGRWAEAVRERLRAMVRELINRGVIPYHPGWTVTELANAVKATPVSRASEIFSLIWYAKRPALSEHDTEMRVLAQQLAHEMSWR